MFPEIYWVNELPTVRLALMPRPRGNDSLSDEIAGLRREGVGLVVSLLESHEATDLGLRDEATLCSAEDIGFLSFPIPDRGVPSSLMETRRLVDGLVAQLMSGIGVAIHCRAGIGRSALVAGCVLLRLGVAPTKVFAMLGRARRLPVPDTAAQEEWLKRFSREG